MEWTPGDNFFPHGFDINGLFKNRIFKDPYCKTYKFILEDKK